MTKELKIQLDLICKDHINQLDIILIKHREKQSESSYKREFEEFSKELIKKQAELNESNDLIADKYIIELQNKSKLILASFLS